MSRAFSIRLATPKRLTGMRVTCGDGTIFVVERAQLAGRKPIAALDLVNGLRLRAGERFALTAG